MGKPLANQLFKIMLNHSSLAPPLPAALEAARRLACSLAIRVPILMPPGTPLLVTRLSSLLTVLVVPLAFPSEGAFPCYA